MPLCAPSSAAMPRPPRSTAKVGSEQTLENVEAEAADEEMEEEEEEEEAEEDEEVAPVFMSLRSVCVCVCVCLCVCVENSPTSRKTARVHARTSISV